MALIFIKHDPATGKRYMAPMEADDIPNGFIEPEMMGFDLVAASARCVITTDFSGVGDIPNGIPSPGNSDGVTLSGSETVLVYGETDQTLNDLYVVSAGPWARSEDAITPGMQIQVMSGGALAGGHIFYCRNTAPITRGVTPIIFGRASALPPASSVTATTIAPGAVTSIAILNGALELRQLSGSGAAPTIAAGPAAGTLPGVSISGTDFNGVITVTTGTLTLLDDVLATVTFAVAKAVAPRTIQLFQANNEAAGRIGQIYIDPDETTTTLFKIRVGLAGALAASTMYKFSYLIIG